MASKERIQAFEDVQQKKNAMINAGVTAVVAWQETAPEQRTDPDHEPAFEAAKREYEAARAGLDRPPELLDD